MLEEDGLISKRMNVVQCDSLVFAGLATVRNVSERKSTFSVRTGWTSVSHVDVRIYIQVFCAGPLQGILSNGHA